MEIKNFNKITKQIFVGYGFNKIDKHYVLELKDIILFVRLDSWHGIKSFRYWLSIKELHKENEPLENKSDICFEEILIHNEKVKGPNQYKIDYNEMGELEYKVFLKNLLCKYFNPYKEKGLLYLKEIGYKLNLTQKASSFIFMPEDVNFNLKSRMLDYYIDDSAYTAIKGYVIDKIENGIIKVHITTKNVERLIDESGNQNFVFYDEKTQISRVEIGQEIAFITTRFKFYNSNYPIIYLFDNISVSAITYFSCLDKAKKDYIKWIDKKFPIQQI
ncbi:MAG: hypothetical protein IKA85_03125 [Clostridia bacterium]|nr:hypothetical protein [Clostridia bacterium]